MITAWLWLRTYWYVPLAVLATAVGFVVWALLPKENRRGAGPAEKLQFEFRALAAEHEAREIQAKAGLQAAQHAVAEKYQSQLQALDYQEMARIEQLRQNPAAMAKAIERLTKS